MHLRDARSRRKMRSLLAIYIVSLNSGEGSLGFVCTDLDFS